MAKRKADQAEPRYAQRHREAMAERSKERHAAAADIGEIPDVVNPARRASCEKNLELFLQTYFPYSTGLSPFSEDHRYVISRIQICLLEGGRYVNAVYRGFAKALALDTPIPTPTGWTTMGAINQGDVVFDESGRPCLVTLVTPTMGDRDCYRVSFDDGESVVCCGDHLWTVQDGYLRKTATLTTTELIRGIEHNGETKTNRKNRYSIPVTSSLQTNRSEEPWLISPYILGVWLGDGNTDTNHVTIGDTDAEATAALIRSEGETVSKCKAPLRYLVGAGGRGTSAQFAVRANVVAMIASGMSSQEIAEKTSLPYRSVCNVRYRGDRGSRQSLICRLRELGVLGNKHIPTAYLRASENDRWALLQGLMDTDGTVSKTGHCSYSTKLPILRDGVRELLWSLGIKNTAGMFVKDGRSYYQVRFTAYANRSCFRLSRKTARLRECQKTQLSRTRRIVSICPVESVPVRCIQVDSPSRLYLCGRAMIPTHNTTIAENSSIWAVLYGHRKFVPIFGSDSIAASQSIDSIKEELYDNDLLFEDFPEACFPIRALEGKYQRCGSQTYQGERTKIEWKADLIQLAHIPGAACSSAILTARGITAGLRGLKVKMPDGSNQRPDAVLLDDFQTDESAGSALQVSKTLATIRKAIVKLGGHRKGLAVIANGTVIYPDDAVSILLDDPAWQGKRIPMVKAWPACEPDCKTDHHVSACPMAHWLGKYKDLRSTYDESVLGDQHRAWRDATEYYRSNRSLMDRGAIVSWQTCYDKEHEISALQHAMNALIDDGAEAFASEYQNDPLKPKTQQSPVVGSELVKRLNNCPRGTVPEGASTLTAFVDVQQEVLFWLVAGWSANFDGHVIDYGTFPDQQRSFFSLNELRHPLSTLYPELGLEARLRAALEALSEDLLGRAFQLQAGDGYVRIDKLGIDTGYQAPTVQAFVSQSANRERLQATKGWASTAATVEMGAWKARSGERRSPTGDWIIQGPPKRLLLYDANSWKSFVSSRLKVPLGGHGALMLFGSSDRAHAMFADHVTAEFPRPKPGRGRMFDAWECHAGRDNHLWDCLVGAGVLASVLGASLPETKAAPKKRRQSLTEMYGQAKGVAVAESRPPETVGAVSAKKKLSLSDLYARNRGARR